MQQPPDLISAARRATSGLSAGDVLNMLASPVIILSAPRSGSTLLFEQLAQHDPFWTIGGESHAVFRAFPHLKAENAELDSMTLTAAHADDATSDAMRRCFLYLLRSQQGVPYLALPPAHRPPAFCFLEKTPRNALNIAFLLKVFPRARFLYLHRDPRQTVSSLIEAWTVGLQTGRFVTFRDLPGWPLPAWCFVLPRGWQNMAGKPLAEIAAFQWAASNLAIMEGLKGLDRSRFTTLAYDQFIRDPKGALASATEALGVQVHGTQAPAAGALPLSRTTLSQPHAEKWRRHEAEIMALMPMLSSVMEQIEAF
ncbi:sulfotransferase family protein [Kordiimonas pumila]|uniref:Sulfotransferase family protein n=1 Tax=Kordiimonas pumila TaxID=2161677 RepID=A0ABV7D3Q9_9PROT|nr:sulfotransferase [Kordiimonas pumila]